MNMLNQKNMIISIVGIAGVLLMAYGAFIYFFVFPSEDKEQANESNLVVNEFDTAKVRLDLEKGTISPGKDLIVKIKLSGLGDEGIIETLRQDDNLSVELNGKKAEINNTEPDGDDALIVTAQTKMTDEIFKDFNDGKLQNLEVRTDLQYKTDKTATKFINTKYQKGTGSSSEGQEISFGKTPEENKNKEEKNPSSEKQIQTASKPRVAKTPIQRPKPPKKKQEARVATRRTPPPPPRATPVIRRTPTPKQIDRGVIDALKRNKVRKNSNSN